MSVLAETLATLKASGVVRARLHKDGTLAYVEFVLEAPGLAGTEETHDKPTSPLRRAAMEMMGKRSAGQ